MWKTWTNHWNKSLGIANATKMQKLRANQAFKRFRKDMLKEHPADHARLKRDLCNAIDRVNVSEPRDGTATRAFLAALERKRWQARRKTELGETMLRAKVQFLTDLTDLARVETLIGAPVRTFRISDAPEGRIDILRTHLNEAAELVANQRGEEVGGLGDLARRAARYARRDEFSQASFNQGVGNTYVSLDGGSLDTKLGLWIQSDANRNITERTVVKDSCFDNDAAGWNNPLRWQNVDNPLNKVVTEAHVMSRLRDTGSENVVRLRHGELRAAELVYRVCWEHSSTVRVTANYDPDVYGALPSW